MGVKKFIVIESWKVDKSYWNSPALSDLETREQFILGLEQARDTVLPQVTLHPYGLLRVEGEVERAEAVLRDDSAYTYLGCRDITAEMHRAAVAERRAIIEIGLLER